MLFRILWIGILCMWCASAQIMDPIVVNNLLTRNETKTTETKIGPRADESNRQTRQLDSSVWSPIPAVWDPRPQSPLNTWWALPWPFNGGQSLVRIAPPSPYWEDYPHHDMGHHHHHHQHHEHEHHKHHEHHEHHHKPHPHLPYPLQNGMYVAQNLGAIHIAPMPGHIGTVIASNMQPAPGTFPPNPFFGPYPPFAPGISVDIAPPIAPPVPPPVPPPAPPVPVARTW